MATPHGSPRHSPHASLLGSPQPKEHGAAASSLPTPEQQQQQLQLAQLQQQVLTMQQAGRLLEQQLAERDAALQRAAAASVAGSSAAAAAAAGAGAVPRGMSTAPRVVWPKIPQPAAFTGEGATATNVEEFKDAMQRQFDYYADSFTTDAQKLQFAVMFLHGKAATWWKATKRECESSGEAVTTWARFNELLDERYRPRQAAETARMRLDDLRQERRDVRAYADFFHKQMAYITDMSVADQIHVFVRGLNAGVKAEVLRARPTSVSDAINAAVQAEQLPGLARGYPGGFIPRGRGQQAGGSGAPMDLSMLGSEGATEAPADTDTLDSEGSAAAPGGPSSSGSFEALTQALLAMQTSQQQQTQQLLALFQRGGRGGQRGGGRKKQQVAGVSKEDARVCLDKGLCLKCKQSGHLARDCQHKGAPVPLSSVGLKA